MGKDFNKSLDLNEILNNNQVGDYRNNSSNRIDQNILDLLMASASSMTSSNNDSLNISDAASLDQMVSSISLFAGRHLPSYQESHPIDQIHFYIVEQDISQKEFNHNAPSFYSAPPFAINYAAHAQSTDTNLERPILHNLRKFKSLSESASSLNYSDLKFPLEEQHGSHGYHNEADKRRFEDSLVSKKCVAKTAKIIMIQLSKFLISFQPVLPRSLLGF